MSTTTTSRRATRLRALIPLLALATSLVAPGAAQAALAAGIDSVARDAAVFEGTDTVLPNASYALHEIKAATGTTVREYVSLDGTVFADSWEGRSTPALQQLLGGAYERYQSEARAHRSGHHLLSINTTDLVASVLRLQRSSIGHVYLPALVPAGISAAGLR